MVSLIPSQLLTHSSRELYVLFPPLLSSFSHLFYSSFFSFSFRSCRVRGTQEGGERIGFRLTSGLPSCYPASLSLATRLLPTARLTLSTYVQKREETNKQKSEERSERREECRILISYQGSVYDGEPSVIAFFDGVTSNMQVLSAKLDHVEVTLSPLFLPLHLSFLALCSSFCLGEIAKFCSRLSTSRYLQIELLIGLHGEI